MTGTETIRIGVVSDTHIPDRVNELHPDLISGLREHRVELILHAGDLSTWRVVEQLEQIAPVKAVSGNRDFLLGNKLNRMERFTINGVQIVLTHGHLNFLTYWYDKMQYMVGGYKIGRYLQRLSSAFPTDRVIVFGHSHHAENRWYNGQLFFNPGSASTGDFWERKTSYGILEIDPQGEIRSWILPLDSAQLVHGRWKNNH